ncbi:MAG: plastocyanin [Aequorivita sp.]|nr:plastocyanin [Aequorivita sp.]|tara:strand:- start:4993 stop:5355 length:363 start_codon:yes stop_codon:yes gene_type:complete
MNYKNIRIAFFISSICLFFTFASGFILQSQTAKSDSLLPKTHVVTIKNMKFSPDVITVKKGDTIKWINKDIVPHDVTETNKEWQSTPLKNKEVFSKKISSGFSYFCSFHTVMKGTVKVKN